jgi:riboflavin kinase/FMN adenylyltransferase
MQIYSQWASLNPPSSRTAIALGTFDGVHVGHQQIIRQAAELARSIDGTSVVFTFANHPLSVIDPARCPPQIVTPGYKAALIAELGIDVLLNIPFTKELLELLPQEFITLLVEALNPAYIVVGPNYSFGYKGMGTPAMLKDAGQAIGFEVVVHPAVYVGDILVSSTTIRQFILEGNIRQAAALLGRPHRIIGKVIAGDGRGKNLGYPTANINIDPGLVTPSNGVYAVYAYVDGSRYRGLANIGTNPTFAGKTRRIEAYIEDFSGDLYQQNLVVDFLEKLRDEQSFPSADALKAQIALDVEAAQKYYK